MERQIQELGAVGGSPPDAIGRLARELPLLAALLAPSRRQFASRRLQNPVMDTRLHHLKRFSLRHYGFSPSTAVFSGFGPPRPFPGSPWAA